MCEYCNKDNSSRNLRGHDGVFYSDAENKHYLYIEHFRNEVYEIEVEYCPKCGRKLNGEVME